LRSCPGITQVTSACSSKGPRIFTCGPHIDGEHPAYPDDSVVARDADEAHRWAERNIEEGATALKIYFRLPLASARSVIEVCNAHHVPCTAHLEILDARELLLAGLHGVEHITSLGSSLLPRVQREAYRQAVLADNDARRDGRYEMFSHLQLDGPPHRKPVGHLAQWADLSSGAMTNRIDRLEQAGLVRRVPDPDDRRGVMVELTAAGRRAWEQSVSAQAEKESVVAAALSVKEKQQLNALLRRLMIEFEKREPAKK